MWQTDYDARTALGFAPVNYFADALGNVGPAQSVAVSTGTNWGLILAAAGVAFAALSYFKGR